jgi:hypothetical protein
MTLYLSPDVERKLRKAISQDDIDLFSEWASPLKWGKPSWSASQLLLHMLADDEKRMWHWAVNLASQENPHIRRYASKLFLHLWEKDRTRAERWLKMLADDEHWVVREDAHNAWGRLLGQTFQEDQAYSSKLDWKFFSEFEEMCCNCCAKGWELEDGRFGRAACFPC